MISPYTAILNYTKDDLKDYLGQIELLTVFQPIVREFKDAAIFRGVLKFILYSYSLESEVIHSIGTSWIGMSKIIYDKAALPDNEDIFDKVANLKNGAVQEAIENWLNFQNNEAWTQYCHYRDVRKQCLQDSRTAEKLKDRRDAMIYSKELLGLMDEAKASFVENSEILKPSIQEFKKVTGKKTLGIQDYAIK